MYKSVFLEERVSLHPSDISKKDMQLDTLLIDRLKTRIESRCISSGYVRPASLEILHRSMGTAENGRFTGNYIFYVKLRCKVFHPETGTPVDCKVLKVNKMGAYAVFDEAMRVLLPRDLHIGNTEFDALNPDDMITIQILRSRFQTNDPFISSVGMFVSRAKKGKAAPVEEEPAVAEPAVAAAEPAVAAAEPAVAEPAVEEAAVEEEAVVEEAVPVFVAPPKKAPRKPRGASKK
jgi:hypothetical protein